MWRSSCTLLKHSASRHKPPSPPRLLAAARVPPPTFSSGAGAGEGGEERAVHTHTDTHTYRYIYRERMWRPPSPPLGLRLLSADAARVPPSPATFSSSSSVAGEEERARKQIHTHIIDTHTYRNIYRERMWRPSPPAARVPPYPARFSSSSSSAGAEEEERRISLGEARKLMRLVNVEALKKKLGTEGKEVIGYPELLEACVRMGVAKSREEAVAFVRVLDDAAVVLVFRDKVYLHPDKVVDLVRKAVPLALTPEDDPRREELKSLLDKKEELDKLAYKQVRRILWTGLGFGILQTGLFFRLTFWEFSWDVMEPIAFFTTATGIVIGYAYFLFTSRDPTYQDFMQRLFLSRQRKLIKKYNFDFDRYMELQKKCKCPLDGHKVSNHQVGVDVEHVSHNDAFH